MSLGRILAVDDDENILSLIDIELTELGFEIVKARTGEEAIKKAANLKPRLLLMDVMLPDMNGAEVLKALYEKEDTKDMPAIFMTGIIAQGEGEGHPELNIGGRMHKVIAKPLDLKELINEVRRIFGLN